MIDKESLKQFIESRLADSPYFLVDLTVSPDNRIVVEIDSDESVDIEKCIELTREVETAFDRDKEDYELEIGSAGITSPLRVLRQYRKYLGKEVEVLAADGKKYRGELAEADTDSFVVICREKVKKEGEKRPSIEEVSRRFEYDKVKYTKYILEF